MNYLLLYSTIAHQMKATLRYLVMLISLAACEKDQSFIIEGFQSREVMVTEADGLHYIVFDLGNGVSTITTFNFIVSGTAGMEADFQITTYYQTIDLGNGISKVSGLETAATTTSNLQYVAIPGQKSITIPVRIIDDSQVEPGYETIQLEIAAISNSDVEISNKFITIFIDDTDAPQENKVQIDLSWQLQTGGSINKSNFDLLLVRNVKFNSSGNTYEQVSGFSSTKNTGFESLILDDVLPNEKYYILIKYLSGSSSAKLVLVVSQNNQVKTATGQVLGNQIEKNLFFGPITKSTYGFTYRQELTEPDWID